jgi:hypothetical protein
MKKFFNTLWLIWKSTRTPKTWDSEFARGLLEGRTYNLTHGPEDIKIAYHAAVEGSAAGDGIGKAFDCGWMEAYVEYLAEIMY